ncbi:TolC family protein [Haloferula sargassicola]|uniref:TolC family protein n=1 Tax=Haloferula sargassicola TaxID=490096 RepID=A0ABP9USC1_9BACT
MSPLVTAGLALALASCQAYRGRPLDPGAGLAAYRRTSLSSAEVIAGLRRAGFSPGGRWTVRKMMAAAESTHPSLVRARADLDAARAGVGVAGTRPPLGVSLDLQRAAQGTTPWTCGLMLDHTIETGGKRAARILKARAEADRAAIGIAQARGDVRIAVANAVIDRHAAAALISVLEENSQLLGSWEMAAGRLSEMGESDRLQGFTLERERSVLERELAAARKQARVAAAALARALGIPDQEAAGLSLAALPATPPAAPSLAAIQETTALGRPDVLDRLAAYAVAETALRLEVANQYPDLHLGPGYSYDQGQRKWLLSASASFPSDAHAAAIRRAEADRTAAAAAFAETQHAALGAAATAREEYAGSLRQWRRAQELVKKSEAIERAQSKLAGAGAGDRVAVLQARYAAGQDRAAQVSARFDAWRAWVALLDAVRGPVEGDVF